MSLNERLDFNQDMVDNFMLLHNMQPAKYNVINTNYSNEYIQYFNT